MVIPCSRCLKDSLRFGTISSRQREPRRQGFTRNPGFRNGMEGRTATFQPRETKPTSTPSRNFPEKHYNRKEYHKHIFITYHQPQILNTRLVATYLGLKSSTNGSLLWEWLFPSFLLSISHLFFSRKKKNMKNLSNMRSQKNLPAPNEFCYATRLSEIPIPGAWYAVP